MSQSTKHNCFTLRAFADGRCVFHSPVDRRLIIGRRRSNEPPPFARIDSDGEARVVVAERTDTLVSRDHVLLEPLGADRVRLRNLSNKGSLPIEPGDILQPGQEREVGAGTRILLESISLRIDNNGSNVWQDKEFSVLDVATMPPQPLRTSPFLSEEMTNDPFMATFGSSVDPSQGRRLLNWVRDVSHVFQGAASDPMFLQFAVDAVSKIVGLPHVVALLYANDEWKIEAEREVPIGTGSRLSTRMLEKLLDGRRTFVEHPLANAEAMESLANIEAVVASPILDETGAIIGAIYASRPLRFDTDRDAPQITELEALLVELIASGVAAGWARLKHERAAIKARIQFESFFGKALAERLETDPELLSGRDSNVTIMFCDIAGFSRICERFGAEVILPWINKTLGAMSECVIKHHGVLVDYIGDELMAMWGAPIELPDHANRAVLAACDIIQRVSELSADYYDELQQPFSVRIGINTGWARVGNVGSDYKFKYGALGNTVNMASRIRGATKYASCQVLISRATADGLINSFSLRRVGNIQVVNINEPVEVLQVMACPDDCWQMVCETYTEALRAYEAGDLKPALQAVNETLRIKPDDHLSIEFKHRILAAMESPGTTSSVWKLEDK